MGKMREFVWRLFGTTIEMSPELKRAVLRVIQHRGNAISADPSDNHLTLDGIIEGLSSDEGLSCESDHIESLVTFMEGEKLLRKMSKTNTDGQRVILYSATSAGLAFLCGEAQKAA